MNTIVNIPPDLQDEYLLAYLARTVHDCAMLEIQDYDTPTGPEWILAVVEPESGSGSAEVPGAYVDADTGDYIEPPESELSVVKSGAWRSVAASDPGAARSGDYSWTEPTNPRRREVVPEDCYSPFAYGGTIVFRPEPTAQGIDRFAACHMVFSAWEGSVDAAFRAAPRLGELVPQAADQPAALAQIRRMIAGENGVLATMALHALLQGTSASVSDAPALFETGDIHRVSTFAYLGLAAPAAGERAEWSARLGRLISETEEPERLLAIAHAAFAVRVFAGRDPTAVETAGQLLADLHRRVRALGIPIGRDTPWLLIFRKSGLSA